MKIVQLDIAGFRSLKNVTWKPGNLNVIIGPNGSGKSNLLKMIELISAAAQGRLSKYVQSVGGIDPILWDGQAEKIEFHLETSLVHQPGSLTGLTYELNLPRIDYEVELNKLGFGGAYRIQHELMREKNNETIFLERTGLKLIAFDGIESKKLNVDFSSEEEAALSISANPFSASSEIINFQQQLAAWSVYHDIRVDSSAAIRQAVVTRNEKRVAPDGQNLINVLHTLYTGDRYFKQAINAAMTASFGDDFEELVFPPAADQRVQLRVRWKTLSREQSAADLSDGTLRFLLLLTILASPYPPPLIAIDEPEAGLHPSMLPIIAEYAAEAAQRTQVIFTTHSDQFLDAFGETKPTTTVAKWANGETTLVTLREEELTYWLKEYSLGSLFRSGELENMA